VIAVPGYNMRVNDPGAQRGELVDPSGQGRVIIDGAVLEAVFELGGGYLVVSTDGDAFEECLHLTLCDRTFARREVIHVGGAYQTGRFRSQAVGPGPRLRFSFFSDEVWQLDVVSAPRWRLHLPRASVRHEPAFPRGRMQLVRQPRV
jgi:hypothetical protein